MRHRSTGKCAKGALASALAKRPHACLQVIWSVMLSFSTAGPLIMFYITTATIYGLGVLWVLFVIVNALGW